MIVYFSGTGNSRYCAQMLAAALGDELFDASRAIKDGTAAALCAQRPWVFVAPTYGWQIPRIFADFLRGGSFTGCSAAYFIMTCGSEIGNAGAKLAQLCREKHFTYRGVLQVVMPENYVAMFPVPDAEEAAKIIAAARPGLENAAEKIRRDEPFSKRNVTLTDRVKTAAIQPLFYRFCITAKPFFATDACNSCGRCAKDCPLNNIEIENGKPSWGTACTHCMRCICGCPKHAIEYGKKSKGKPRYQCAEYKSGNDGK